EKMGLGPEDLQADNPGLVYARISGFGQSGPFRDLPAYDLVVQAMSGLMAATGEEGGVPLKTGESMADLMGGLFGSWSILAALFQRTRTGRGTVLDIAMYDAVYSLLTTSHALYFYADRLPERVGNRHPLSTPFGCYATCDGLVAIAVLTPAQFARLATLIGHPDLPEDPRFVTDEVRTQNEPALKALIEAWSGTQSTQAAMVALAEIELPSAPIWDLGQASTSDHAKARALVRGGARPVVGQPVWFDGEKPVAPRPAPELSEDADYVLRDLCGLDANTVSALKQDGVIR
ncbi:MAG: CoA transferase, partial [Pseudomonadota bacterium]